MNMTEVNDMATRKEFLIFPVRLYQSDKNFIRNLDKDVENIFNPAKNKFFRSGEAIRWLCVDDKGRTIGRIAAFYTHEYEQEQPTGGIGFLTVSMIRQLLILCLIVVKNGCKIREWKRWTGLLISGNAISFGDY